MERIDALLHFEGGYCAVNVWRGLYILAKTTRVFLQVPTNLRQLSRLFAFECHKVKPQSWSSNGEDGRDSCSLPLFYKTRRNVCLRIFKSKKAMALNTKKLMPAEVGVSI